MRLTSLHVLLAVLACATLAADVKPVADSAGKDTSPNGDAAAKSTDTSSFSFIAQVKKALDFVESAGNFGFAVLLVFFFAVVCLSLPTTPIELSAGFMYGPVWGSIAGITGKTIGSFIAFMLARLLGEKFGWKVPASLESKMSALKTAPLVTMIGIRVAPLPLGLKNYGLSLCGVDAVPYVLASLVVNVPFSIMWGSLGASCSSLGDALNFDTSKVSFLGLVPDWAKALIATGAVLAIGYAVMRRMTSKPAPKPVDSTKKSDPAKSDAAKSAAAKGSDTGTDASKKGEGNARKRASTPEGRKVAEE